MQTTTSNEIETPPAPQARKGEDSVHGLLGLYVWENVLTDYTSGMVCALAHTEAEAWDMLRAADHTAWWSMRGQADDRNDPRTPEELGDDVPRPKRVEKPEAFVCWGGG